MQYLHCGLCVSTQLVKKESAALLSIRPKYSITVAVKVLIWS